MQAPGRGAVPYQRARELVAAAVPRHVEAWAKTIGLQSTDARFAQFREDVTEALHACMRAHIAGKHRRYERISDLREDFIALGKAATAAIAKLRDVENILKRLPPMQHDPAFRLIHDPWATALELDGLAKAARQHADDYKSADRGGPSRMRTFDALAEGLIRAYSGATKRKGTGGNVREGTSRLRGLVEAVLPTAGELAIAATGKQLKTPAAGSLGDRLDEIATRLARGAEPPKI
jgi:hypothetical protein